MKLKLATNSHETPLGAGSELNCGECGDKIVEGDMIVHQMVEGTGHYATHWTCLNIKAAENGLVNYSAVLDNIASVMNARLEKVNDRAGRREILQAVIEGKFKPTDEEILAGVKGMMKELANG